MGVADYVLESISGHLSRRMLEHYSHIRIDAKRQALDALDNLRRGDDAANGNGGRQMTRRSQRSSRLATTSHHSLLLSGSPPSGKPLIPLERRDVRVVEGARLEIDCGCASSGLPQDRNVWVSLFPEGEEIRVDGQ